MRRRRLWALLLLVAVLTPLGLWLPERLGAGDAWGEWSLEDLKARVGFAPQELARGEARYHAPAPDYAPRGWEEHSLTRRSAAYIASAVIGAALCAGALWLLGRWLARREAGHAS